MDRPPPSVTLELDAGEAGAIVSRCLDSWHGFIGAVVSRPITIRVRFAASADLVEDEDGLTVVLPESLVGSPELPHVLLLAVLDAVDAAGRRWPHDKPRRLWRGKPPAVHPTERALAALSPGEMLLLARRGDDNGDTIADYLEERLADEGLAEPADSATGDGVVTWVLAPLPGPRATG